MFLLYSLNGITIWHVLTHLGRMNFPISIGRTSLFPILDVLGGIFLLYSNSNRTFREQTVDTLIRCRILLRPIRVCAVWLCQRVWIQIRPDSFVGRDLGSSCLQTQSNLVNSNSSGLHSPKSQGKGQP